MLHYMYRLFFTCHIMSLYDLCHERAVAHSLQSDALNMLCTLFINYSFVDSSVQQWKEHMQIRVALFGVSYDNKNVLIHKSTERSAILAWRKDNA